MKNKKNKIAGNNRWIRLVTLTLLISTILTLNSTQNVSDEAVNGNDPRPSISNPPILINGTAELDAFCDAGQNGTFSNPYIIEDYVINASTAHGIHILNTDSYLIIRNCTVENGTANSYNGIYLDRCSNVLITNNTLVGNEDGILLYPLCNNNLISNNTVTNNEFGGIHLAGDCNDNTIQENIAKENDYGIWIATSYSNVIQRNSLTDNFEGLKIVASDINFVTNNTFDNDYNGIRIESSESNNFSANIMENDGIFVNSYSYHNNIAANNTVNGKPILYFEDQQGITLTSEDNAGQVILVNCDYATIDGQNISNVGSGIQLIYSEHGLISNNTVDNSNMYGIFVYESNNITVRDNIVSNSEIYGISVLWYSLDCIVTGNTLLDNENAIEVSWQTNNTIISHNTAIGSLIGITVGYCYNATLVGNYVEGSRWMGIDVSSQSFEHRITENVLVENDYGLVFSPGSNDSIIWENYFIDNSRYQAFLPEGTENSWDYNSKGNYWSDYTSRYPNAALNDGVWDTPYELMWGNADNFPLYDDLISPTWENPIQDQICYDDELFIYDINATDEAAIGEYWLNDTSTFQIDSDGLITNTTTLFIGDYGLEVFVNDTSGNNLTATFHLTVVQRTNNVWRPINDTVYLECYDDELHLWMSLIVTTVGESEIKLTFQQENPTAVDLGDNVENYGFYIIEVQDSFVIESIEVNFYLSDNFTEDQKDNLQLYSLGTEWSALQADVNILENKITVFLTQADIKGINRFTVGYSEVETSSFEIPGYSVEFLVLFFSIPVIAIGLFTKRKLM